MATPSTRMTARERRIEKRRSEVYPLEKLPTEIQEKIARQVAADAPPDQWLAIGPPGSPRPLAWIPARGWFEWHWSRGIDPEERRPTIPPALRQQVVDRDGYVCQLCGDDVEPADVHLDHIKPWSKGGQHTLSNLQVTHSLCNLRKGAREE